jgi:hypothetical protein
MRCATSLKFLRGGQSASPIWANELDRQSVYFKTIRPLSRWAKLNVKRRAGILPVLDSMSALQFSKFIQPIYLINVAPYLFNIVRLGVRNRRQRELRFSSSVSSSYALLVPWQSVPVLKQASVRLFQSSVYSFASPYLDFCGTFKR